MVRSMNKKHWIDDLSIFVFSKGERGDRCPREMSWISCVSRDPNNLPEYIVGEIIRALGF